jgi:hypothetical protein
LPVSVKTMLPTLKPKAMKVSRHIIAIRVVFIAFAVLTFVSCRSIPVANDKTTVVSPKMNSGSDDYSARRLYPVVRDGKWGYVNGRGQTIIKPQFYEAFEFSGGLALVSFASSFICGMGAHSWGYIDSQGRPILQPEASYLGDKGSFHEGLAMVRIGTFEKYGFIDTLGSLVIKAKYDLVQPFSDGLAAVMIGSKWGYINRSGELVISPQFDRVSPFQEGIAGVELNNKIGFLNTQGQLIISPTFESDEERFFPTESLPIQVGEGLIAVKSDGKWGFINSTGKFVVKPQFYRVEPFNDGLAAASRERGKVGFLDKFGNFVIEPRFEKAQNFSEGLAAVRDNGRYGYIDTSGEFVIKPKFKLAGDFKGGVARVSEILDEESAGEATKGATGIPKFTNDNDNDIRYIDKNGNPRLSSGPLGNRGRSAPISCLVADISMTELELESSPSGARAYLVPFYKWEHNPTLATNLQSLSYFEVADGLTNIKVKVYPQVYMALFELDGKWLTRKIDVIASKPNRTAVKFLP